MRQAIYAVKDSKMDASENNWIDRRESLPSLGFWDISLYLSLPIFMGWNIFRHPEGVLQICTWMGSMGQKREGNGEQGEPLFGTDLIFSAEILTGKQIKNCLLS